MDNLRGQQENLKFDTLLAQNKASSMFNYTFLRNNTLAKCQFSKIKGWNKLSLVLERSKFVGTDKLKHRGEVFIMEIY